MKNRQIQGLRAYAAALVVASHNGFLSQGGVANDFFFCLSGFMAVKPYSLKEVEIHSWKDITKYYYRKLLSILPLYYIVLLSCKLLTDDYWFTWESLFRALLFIECPGHLWFLQQIICMYCITPFIILFMQLIGRCFNTKRKYLFQSVALFALAFLTKRYLTTDVFCLNGNGGQLQFVVWQYLIGMAFGCITKGIYNEKRDLNNTAIMIVECMCLLFPLISSNIVLGTINASLSEYYIGWEQPLLCTCLAGIMITAFSLDENGVFCKFFSKPIFTTLGDISYGTYIIHWYFLGLLQISQHHFKNFLIVYTVTICVAYFINKASTAVVSLIDARTHSHK